MSPIPILIRGAGPVGLACALFLVRRGIAAHRIGLDPSPAEWGELPAHLSQRVLALSEGSRQLLQRIAVLPPGGQIRQVEVTLLNHVGRTRIDCADLGVPALGRVLRYGELLASLRTRAATVAWADPQTLQAQDPLIIHAEGDPGEEADERHFDQAALLGEVHAPEAPAGLHSVAFERFTPHGPLALLPLAGAGLWSLVWCDRVETTRARLAADRSLLATELRERIGPRLGPLSLQGPLGSAPLVRRMRRRVHDERQVWIGNAAQSLHPVAGQGLNLGLRDAFELADILGQADRTRGLDTLVLHDWQRRRRADRRATVGLTDLLASSFTWPLARPVQSAVLGMLDISPALRRSLASRLMFGLRG